MIAMIRHKISLLRFSHFLGSFVPAAIFFSLSPPTHSFQSCDLFSMLSHPASHITVRLSMAMRLVSQHTAGSNYSGFRILTILDLLVVYGFIDCLGTKTRLTYTGFPLPILHLPTFRVSILLQANLLYNLRYIQLSALLASRTGIRYQAI